MTRPQMSGTTTSVHLSVMAAADTMVLVSGLVPDWLGAFTGGDVIFSKLHPATCKLEKFVFYTSGDTSIWVLVVFTIDRFWAICFPLRKRDCWLPSRAKYYAIGAFVLAVTKNVPVFWTRGAEYLMTNDTVAVLVHNCGRPTPAYSYYESFVRPWIVLLTVVVLPFAIILFCNVFIVRVLFVVQRIRSEQAIVSASDKSMIQTTAMCLSASFCFLVCITPSVVLLVGKPYWNKPPDRHSYKIAKAVNNLLVFVNHSVNFFLYCMTGQRFRRVIVSLCRKPAVSSVPPAATPVESGIVARAVVPDRRPTSASSPTTTTRVTGSPRDDRLAKGRGSGRDVMVVEVLAGATTSSSNGPPNQLVT